MDIRIKKVTKSNTAAQTINIPEISIVNENTTVMKPSISISDVEAAPGPDQNTYNESQVRAHDEFHFLKSIIIDNELY